MANTTINYPYRNYLQIQETGSGMYFCPATSGVLSGNWLIPGIPTQSGNLINKGYLESGTRAYNKTSFGFYNQYASITGNNLAEYWIPNNMVVTGVTVASTTIGSGVLYRTSGASGLAINVPYTGNIYQINSSNTQTNSFGFSYETGLTYKNISIDNMILSGYNRVGLGIVSGISGAQNLNIGVFGYLQY